VSQIVWVITHFSIAGVIDLALVALLFYLFLRLIEGTRAVQLLRGMIVLVVAAAVISSFSPFPVLNFIIRTAMPALWWPSRSSSSPSCAGRWSGWAARRVSSSARSTGRCSAPATP